MFTQNRFVPQTAYMEALAQSFSIRRDFERIDPPRARLTPKSVLATQLKGRQMDDPAGNRFNNPGYDGIRNPAKPHLPGGHPSIPDHPDHPGLGHGHGSRPPVKNFLGNIAIQHADVGPNPPRWQKPQ